MNAFTQKHEQKVAELEDLRLKYEQLLTENQNLNEVT
jgi:hypothetical protein